MKHPQIEECCVFGIPDKTWGESVKAVCVLKSGSKMSAESVRDYVGEKIAVFKKPREVVFVKELPYENNQIDRDKVKVKWGE